MRMWAILITKELSRITNWSRGWWRWKWQLCSIAGDAFVFRGHCCSSIIDCQRGWSEALRASSLQSDGRKQDFHRLYRSVNLSATWAKKRLFCYERMALHLSAAQINPFFLLLWNASPTEAFGRHNYTQRQNQNVAIDLLTSKTLYASIEAASLPAAICASICFHMDAALSATQFRCSISLSQSAMVRET